MEAWGLTLQFQSDHYFAKPAFYHPPDGLSTES